MSDSLFTDTNYLPTLEEGDECDPDADGVSTPGACGTAGHVGSQVIYSFYPREQTVVREIAIGLRALLGRDNISPQHISELGKVLFAVERLPLVTPDFSCHLSLEYRCSTGEADVDLSLDSEEFSLLRTYLLLDPHGDHGGETSQPLVIGIGWRSDENSASKTREWLGAFHDAVNSPKYEIELDLGDAPIDWDIALDDDKVHPWRQSAETDG